MNTWFLGIVYMFLYSVLRLKEETVKTTYNPVLFLYQVSLSCQSRTLSCC